MPLDAGGGEQLQLVFLSNGTVGVTRKGLGFSAVSAALVCAAALSAAEPFAQSGAAPTGERSFLSRVRRLTVEGKRAGEGYWSPDGKRLVFQSERDAANPFYQIFVLDLTTGDTKRISPGMGKTTCAFFRPGSTEIMYASTHLDPKSLDYQAAPLRVGLRRRVRHLRVR